MNVIYEAAHEPSRQQDMRTHIGCLSAWSSQGLVAYTVERTIDGRQLMELRIFNSESPWDDFSCPLRVGRTIKSLSWSATGEKLLVGDSLGRLRKGPKSKKSKIIIALKFSLKKSVHNGR